MIFPFLFHFIIILYSCICVEYLYDSNLFESKDEFYSINIGIEPFYWIVFIDTYNDYFILYDYPNGEDWPSDIIKRSDYIEKGEKTVIYNYNKQIQANVFTTKISLKGKSNSTIILNIYHTNEKAKDDLVWSSISHNVRQLSLGFGLTKNTTFNYIYNLYNANIIDSKAFSFEHGPEIFIKLGKKDPELLKRYKSNATIILDNQIEHWGFPMNSIIIDKKHFKINKFAYVNSGMKTGIRSSYIFQIIKSFLADNDNYGLNCKQEYYNKRITLLCEIKNDNVIWPNITISIGKEESFVMSMSKLFECGRVQCRLNFVCTNIGDEMEDDDKIKEMTIHVGMNFLSLFNLVEFDFDGPSISFYSNKYVFFKNENVVKIDLNEKYLFVCLSIIMIVNLMILIFVKFEFINKLS